MQDYLLMFALEGLGYACHRHWKWGLEVYQAGIIGVKRCEYGFLLFFFFFFFFFVEVTGEGVPYTDFHGD